ncbi:MAG: hypothetical protein K5770_01325, partial [Lachnospiraceae bacterium]|nr:hypothetical protein [Lachnospiraceae bacterium]
MKKKSVFSASAVVAGNGIGSGVMAIPYFISKTGIVGGSIAFLSAYLISVLLHLMIAQILLNTGDTADILSAFHIYLFRGKLKNFLRIAFFIIMVVVLETNLAAYISGAAEIMGEIIPGISAAVFAAGFYILAAVTVLLGLHAICISEEVTVSVMGAILLMAAFISLRSINLTACRSFLMIRGIPEVSGVVAAYSMIMFSFSAIFAMPQVIGILGPDGKEIRKSVFYGLFMNLVISVTVTACAIIT